MRKVTNNEIVEWIAKEQLVETICNNLRVPATYYADLVQEIYLIVLEYSNAKLNSIYEKKQFNFWLSRVTMNNWNSTTSRFWKKYRKYSSKQDENADLNKLSQQM